MGLRNVLRYRRRSIVSGFAIIVSVFVLMLLRGMINGSESMIYDQLVLGQLGAVQIHKKGFAANVSNPPLSFAFDVDDAFMAKVRAVPGVQDASARIFFPCLTNANDKTVATPVLAIDPAHEYNVCPLKTGDVTEGKLVSADSSVMTQLLRRQLGLELGDEVTLVSQDFEGVMNAAVLKSGGYLNGIPLLTTSKKLLFVPLATAQELLRVEGKAVEVAVSTDDFLHPEDLKARMQAALGGEYEVEMWRDRAEMVIDSMRTRRAILGWVSVIFLGIALIGVANTMLMSVLGRTREIGTMMAVGMKRIQIVELFISEALVLGIFASLLGALLGQALVLFLHARGLTLMVQAGSPPFTMRPTVEWDYTLRMAAYVSLGCAVASIYPAYRASRLKPIEAMGAV